MKTNTVSDKILKLATFNLNLLTTFCLIYSTRSLTETAEILEVTPPSISHSLRKLRLHFQDPLFTRHGNTISPTVFADDLYAQLRKTLEIMSDSVDRSQQSNKRETIVIYSPFSAAVHNLAIALLEIKARKLNYKIKYIETNIGILDSVELLNLRKADIVFSASPVMSSTLTCVLIRELTPVLVSRIDHPFQKNSISIEELKNLDLVSHLTADNMIYQRKQALLATLKTTRITFETNSLIMLLTVLSETECIGFITQQAFDRYRHIFKLRVIQTQFSVPKMSVYITYRKEMEHKENFMQLLHTILDD
ncbi:LysR family transcriptional regulator [Buttiauxella gaviniae]|uniref:LysR family transcriptional regulator n=1 Tax=Buttiauxella gaviniae TaxID=82990 RepID=A0ABV3NVR3_9ENTR